MGAAQKKMSGQTVLLDNPLDGEQLFLDAMFGGGSEREVQAEKVETETLNPTPAVAVSPRPPQKSRPSARRAEKPLHYKVVSISLYLEDIDRLEDMVKELKKRGHYKANKSQLIRHALMQVNLDEIPRGV